MNSLEMICVGGGHPDRRRAGAGCVEAMMGMDFEVRCVESARKKHICFL